MRRIDPGKTSGRRLAALQGRLNRAFALTRIRRLQTRLDAAFGRRAADRNHPFPSRPARRPVLHSEVAMMTTAEVNSWLADATPGDRLVYQQVCISRERRDLSDSRSAWRIVVIQRDQYVTLS